MEMNRKVLESRLIYSVILMSNNCNSKCSNLFSRCRMGVSFSSKLSPTSTLSFLLEFLIVRSIINMNHSCKSRHRKKVLENKSFLMNCILKFTIRIIIKIRYLRKSFLRIFAKDAKISHLRSSAKFWWWKMFAKCLETFFWLFQVELGIKKIHF